MEKKEVKKRSITVYILSIVFIVFSIPLNFLGGVMKNSIGKEEDLFYILGGITWNYILAFIIGLIIWRIMKKRYSILIMFMIPALVLSLISLILGLGNIAINTIAKEEFEVGENSENTMIIEDYDVSFTFSNDWEKVIAEIPFDLQCTNGDAYASIFTYHKIDLTEEQTPADIFNIQNDDILSRRDNTIKVSEEEMYEFENKLIHSVLYSGEKDGRKNYYYFNLIEFKDADVFAWVLFSASPSYSLNNIDEWNAIITSANWSEE